MANDTLTIPIITPDGTVTLIIYGDNNTTYEAPDAIENGEAQFQLYEGRYYEYELDSNDYTLETSEVVSQSRVSNSTGRIAPNIYVGTLTIGLLLKTTGERTGEVKLEVRSMKTEYRSDYRQMLKDIAQKSIDLIFYHNSIVTQQFTANADKEPQTLYQRFAFLKSIIEGEEFNYGLQKILYAPVTRWSDTTTERDTRSLKRVGNSVMKQLASSGSRVKIPLTNPLSAKLKTIPTKVNVLQKVDSVDTPENRFIKFALSHFLYFVEEIIEKAKDADRLRLEATLLASNIENYLSHSIFKEISNPDTVSLNSPILQRKEGYRETLRAWIMFEYAANLAWHGGEDVYSGGKKNIAVLYEYWLFFKLLDVVKETFKVESKSLKQLISVDGGLSLNLKQGKHLPVKGVYESGTRRLNIQFSYNRTFNGESKYPDGGSWSRPLRPDYTLSIWPVGVTDVQAEEQELITHIHFDAKYRIENFSALIEKGEDLSDEKLEQSKGTYKRADILKMHTYRDAIRRTSGAYVLYPGSDGPHNILGFHEILPGLGAFAIRPDSANDGTIELKIFLQEVLEHFMNRASQRETLSYKTYDTLNKKSDEGKEPFIEAYGDNRGLLPTETFVIIGYCKSQEQLDWILKNNLYNFRTGTNLGSLPLGRNEVSARYLVLHGKDETKTGRIFKLKEIGPKVFSKADLLKKKYPDPTGELYLVYTIDRSAEEDFNLQKWDLNKLANFTSHRASAKPFSVTLVELLNAK